MRKPPRPDYDPAIHGKYRKDGVARSIKVGPRNGPRNKGPHQGHNFVITDEMLERFYTALTQYPNITRAFEMSGAPSLQGLYQRRYRDEEMSGRWSAALKIGYESLEAEAYRRAFEGVDEPVFYQGEEVARVKKPSDSLMMFLLKGGMPEKYKDRVSSEVSGPGGGPIQSIGIEINDPIEVSMVYQKMIRGE